MRTKEDERERIRESGKPGGGAGRRDEGLGRSGVYPLSGPPAPGDAVLVAPGAWGQGPRGPAGYDDHGESELTFSNVTPEKCRDLMTKDPVCCVPTEHVDRAAQKMKQFDTGILPVVETQSEKRLLGVITDRDLTLRVLGERRCGVTVAEVMTRDVVICSPDDDCSTALHLMERHRLRRIPAVDRSGRVVGIIAQSDIALRMRDAARIAELVTEVSRTR